MFICLISISKTSATSYYADTYIVMDADTKQVYAQKNMNKKLLTASIAKIVTTITAIENCNLNDDVVISKDTIKQDGSSIYAKLGDTYKMKDLLIGLMLRSGNDAAYQIAEHCGNGDVKVFVGYMNKLAKELNLENSTFQNPSGLDDYTKNYSSAYDMAIITTYAMDNPIFNEIYNMNEYKVTTGNDHTYFWKNKHRLVGESNVIGGKPGYTDDAKRTLVTSFSDGKNKYVVVTFRAVNDFEMHRELFDKYKNNTLEEYSLYIDDIEFLEFEIENKRSKLSKLKLNSKVNLDYELVPITDDLLKLMVFQDEQLIYQEVLKYK